MPECAKTQLCALVETICVKAAEAFDLAIEQGKRVKITQLSKELSATLKVSDVMIYHLLTQYAEYREDLQMYFGPGGGYGKKRVANE